MSGSVASIALTNEPIGENTPYLQNTAHRTRLQQWMIPGRADGRDIATSLRQANGTVRRRGPPIVWSSRTQSPCFLFWLFHTLTGVQLLDPRHHDPRSVDRGRSYQMLDHAPRTEPGAVCKPRKRTNDGAEDGPTK